MQTAVALRNDFIDHEILVYQLSFAVRASSGQGHGSTKCDTKCQAPCMPTIYFKLATPVCQHAQYRMWSSQLTLPNAAAAAESF
jgi:hypothetical protein